MKIREQNMLSRLSFLIGFSFCSDVIYLFQIGNTKFLMGDIVPILVLIYLLYCGYIDFSHIKRTIGIGFQLFILFIFFSGIMCLFTFSRLSYVSRFVVGIVYLMINLIAMIDAMTLYDYKGHFVKGCVAGFTLNLVFVLIEYIMWTSGHKTFRLLYNLFPQESFALNIYNFGAKGLFLEPSHFAQYLGKLLPLVICFYTQKGTVYTVSIIGIIFAIGISGSGTAAVVFVGMAIIVIVKASHWDCKIRKKTFLFMMLFFISGILFLSFSESGQGIWDSFTTYVYKVFKTSSVNDESNIFRLEAMKSVIKLIAQNPLGCGWNMANTLIRTTATISTPSSFSDILDMTLDVGILGIMVYLGTVINIMIQLFRRIHEDENNTLGIFVSIFCIIVMQLFADCPFDSCILFVFGLAYEHLYRLKYCKGGLEQ